METNNARHEALYALEYSIIPKLIKGECLFNFDFITNINEIKDECETSELNTLEIEFHKMKMIRYSSTDIDYLLFLFPEPTEEPLAYFGMVVKYLDAIYYYTLEKGNDMNFVCIVSPDSHQNYGVYDGPIEPEAFSKYVLDKFYTNPKLSKEQVEAAFDKGFNFLEDEWFSQAAKYFHIAAEHGHAEAQEHLGELYMGGMGVKEDREKGVMWLRKSADQGNPDAYWALGYNYMNGYGVEKDLEEAKKWFHKALENGCESAQKWLDKIEGENLSFKD